MTGGRESRDNIFASGETEFKHPEDGNWQCSRGAFLSCRGCNGMEISGQSGDLGGNGSPGILRIVHLILASV